MRISYGFKIITAFKKTPSFQDGDELNSDMPSSFGGNPALQSGEDVIRTSLRENLGASAVRTSLRENLVNVQRGFTLIELLLVMAIIGVLMTVSVIIINPAAYMARARDTKRETDLYSILTSVLNFSAQHSGALPDTDGDPLTSNFPTSLTCIGTGGSCFNLGAAGVSGDILVPNYMANMPIDPKTGTNQNSGYLIMVDANGRLTASASGEKRTIGITK